jgi:ISXO2-like transposase domain
VIEADEAYIGGKARNKAFGAPPKKYAVFTLVERGGEARSRHVADVTAKTLRETIVTQASRESYLMTDEALVYERLGKEFAGHGTVNHSADEYVRTGGFHHTNTVEGFFALFKRAIYGQFHNISEAHLHRYLAEADFKFNHRETLGYDDAERAAALLRGAKGKRLLYRQPDAAAHA